MKSIKYYTTEALIISTKDKQVYKIKNADDVYEFKKIVSPFSVEILIELTKTDTHVMTVPQFLDTYSSFYWEILDQL